MEVGVSPNDTDTADLNLYCTNSHHKFSSTWGFHFSSKHAINYQIQIV